MRSDEDIRRDVEAELKWDPDIDSTDIAVAVKDGVVTLTGFVRSYTQKWDAERVAKRVVGVRAVANDIEVRLPSGTTRPDPEIARDAVAKLKAAYELEVEAADTASRPKRDDYIAQIVQLKADARAAMVVTQ